MTAPARRCPRGLRRLAAAALAVALPAAPAHAQAPGKVVSFNVCADQLVLALADRDQIAGLSFIARDPRVSFLADRVGDLPRLPARTESVVRTAADLVLTGPMDRARGRRMLEAFRVRVVEVELVADIEQAVTQIREVAAALGQPARGEALVADIEQARARLGALRRPQPLTALAIERRGWTAGARSLLGSYLGEAGLVPPAGVPGGYGGFMPLERLITAAPDLLVMADTTPAGEDQGSAILMHPAVEARWPRARRIEFPERLWMCGGPAVPAALHHLADRLAALPR